MPIGDYHLYNDLYNKFDELVFDEMSVFKTFNNKNLQMSWEVYLNGEEVDCFVIEFLNVLCQTCVKARFPQGVGSCEKLS